MAKIAKDDAAAVEKCRSGIGADVYACLVQTRGKRARAEQEAEARINRTAVIPPLPKKKAETASKVALETAKSNKRGTNKDIDSETKAANAECQKLDGAARKTCNTDVTPRRDEARDLADAMYKKGLCRVSGCKTKWYRVSLATSYTRRSCPANA